MWLMKVLCSMQLAKKAGASFVNDSMKVVNLPVDETSGARALMTGGTTGKQLEVDVVRLAIELKLNGGWL